jgi:hypothetical protein
VAKASCVPGVVLLQHTVTSTCLSMFSQLRPMQQHKGSNISIIQTDPQLTVAAEYHRLATSRRRSKQQRIRVTSCVGSSLLQLLVLLLAVLGPPGELAC